MKFEEVFIDGGEATRISLYLRSPSKRARAELFRRMSPRAQKKAKQMEVEYLEQEDETHKVNRKSCLTFLDEMLSCIRFPISLLKPRMNPDFEHDMIKNQKSVMKKLQRIQSEIEKLRESFDY